MRAKIFKHNVLVIYAAFLAGMLLSAGCKSTQNLGKGQYLVRKNRIVISSDHKISDRAELKDNLSKQIILKPNSNALDIPPFWVPYKLWRYNRRYAELHNKPDSSLPKSVERPVIIDSALMIKTIQNMKAFLFNQGYYYAKVRDTFIVKHKKAYVTYKITMGKNYKINKVLYFIDDSAIANIVMADTDDTRLQRGREFSYGLVADERSRLTAMIRNKGYFKFTQDNISFIQDTGDKAALKNVESPIEGAVNFISSSKTQKRSTLDLEVYIRLAEDTNAFKKYTTNAVHVFPDYKSFKDLLDTSLIEKQVDSMEFFYHHYYLHPGVLYQHIYMGPNELYSQLDYDKTQAKLTELGIFQYVRVLPAEDRNKPGFLDYNILLSPAKRFDFSTVYELSNGSDYSLGHQLGISIRDKNFLKGGNLLSIGVSGGVEFAYNNDAGNNFFNNFGLLTVYYGFNPSIDFPKFLAPIASSLFDNSNLPHTIIGFGDNAIDRVNYFKLVTKSFNFTYNWRQTQTVTWTLSPVFVNIITVPVVTDSFQKVLDSNEYLQNSYKPNFIEGENITFTYDDQVRKHNRNYSYLKLGIEEAGGVLSAINNLGASLNDLYQINYAQYTKFDFDAKHFFTIDQTVLAFRFDGGIGIPYGQSSALPYIKQYFSGGPYSLRGWRIRTLGPGSYYDSTVSNNATIDRTGDIKLEFIGEYRFPIAPMFGGSVKMNGAFFYDAGNIWLARKDPGYPGGEFEWNTLGQDIAADVGAGARFDIASFLTLRIDLAMPVKEPYYPYDNGWVFKEIDFNNPTWRSNNLVLNLSIGYPF